MEDGFLKFGCIAARLPSGSFTSSPSNKRVTDGNASADCLQEKQPRIDEEKCTNMKKRVAPVSAAEKEEVNITGITTQPSSHHSHV